MKLKKLKELLEKGAITQEEFDEMEKNAEPDDLPADPPKSDPPNDDPPADNQEKKLEKMIQAAVDRATNKLGNENKNLKEKLEAERKKNLTAEELKQLEFREKEQELTRKEQEIKDKENRMYAIKALKKAELDDGSEDALDLVEFVMGVEESDIDVKVKALQKFAQRIAKNTTDGIYRTNGREPGKGNSGASKDNPWSKDAWNFTKQMELELSNPELAKTLRASVGK